MSSAASWRRRLGERLVPSTLELSGCDAMFVLADAEHWNWRRGPRWFGVTLNRGQTCIAVRRIFVQRARYAEFVAALRPFFDMASPMKLVSPGQLDSAKRLIGDAVKRRRDSPLAISPIARLRRPRLAANHAPSLLLNVVPGSQICSEASFAPIAAVIPFDGD